jgi:LCP family protein required for cell wall assembly
LQRRWKITILIVVLVPLLIAGFFAGYFINRLWQLSQAITLSSGFENVAPAAPVTTVTQPELPPDNSNSNLDNQVDEATKQEYRKQFGLLDYAKEKTRPSKGTPDRINVLILGKAVPNYPGADLTDTIMLASINPQTYETSLLSIPRDLLVKVPGTSRQTKINAVYVEGLKHGGQPKGIEMLEQVVSDVTGQKVDYYVMVNFTAFQQAIDALSGVDVNVTDDIFDNRYPGPNYSYETFQINKGWHHLDGATALKYVRVRHNSGGDFGRALRQQQVIEASKDKFFLKRGLMESLDFFNGMLKIVEANVKTDIGFGDYLPFLFLLKDVNVHQVVNKVLDNSNDGLLVDYHPVMGRVVAYTLLPRAGNYFEIRRLAANIFHLDEISRREASWAQEGATVAVLVADKYAGYRGQVENILRSKGYQIVNAPADVNTVNLWQRKAESRLPAVSGQNRASLSSDSLIDKISMSPDNLNKTVIYDNAEGAKPFSLDDLSERLDSQVSLYKDTNIQADFVIFLGDNVKTVFQKTDDSQFFLTDEGLEQEKLENSQ